MYCLIRTHFLLWPLKCGCQTLWAKICNRGRLFYRLTLNFIVKKFPQCKTVNFIGNLIIINYPEHLFLHYHHYEKVFISTQTVLNNVYTNTDTSMTVQYLPTISAGLFYKPKISTCGTRGKVRGSPTSLVFILWRPWMNVQNVASIYQRVLAYFSLEVVEKQLTISINGAMPTRKAENLIKFSKNWFGDAWYHRTVLICASWVL